MKILDIRFAKEYTKEREAYQLSLIARLQQILPYKLNERFGYIQVRIRLSSANVIDLTGCRNKEEKEQIMAFLEEFWMDDSWLEL